MDRRLIGEAHEIRIILVIGFIVTTIFMLFAFTAEWYLFRPSPYLSAFQSINLYRIFPALLADQVASALPEPASQEPGRMGRFADQVQYLDQTAFEEVFKQAFPPVWLQNQSESNLVQLFNYLNLRTSQLILVVPMEEVKSQLRGQLGADLARRLITSWPACTPEQIQVMIEAGPGADPRSFPVCQPPEELLPAVLPFIESRIQEFAEEIPGRLDLVRLFRNPAGGWANLQAQDVAAGTPAVTRHTIAYILFRWIMRLSPIAAVWMLLSLALFVAYSGERLLTWLGGALLATGLLTFGISIFIGQPLFRAFTRSLADGDGIRLGRLLSQAVLLVGDYVAQRYFLYVGLQAGLLTLIGLALLGYWYYQKRTLGENI